MRNELENARARRANKRKPKPTPTDAAHALQAMLFKAAPEILEGLIEDIVREIETADREQLQRRRRLKMLREIAPLATTLLEPPSPSA